MARRRWCALLENLGRALVVTSVVYPRLAPWGQALKALAELLRPR